jgi:hypothetical protein
MSDYLSTLAARSLDVAPVVQPRLTSWFESPRTAAAPSVPDAVTQAPIASRSAAEPSTREIVVRRDERSSIEEPRAFDDRRMRLIPEPIASLMDTRPVARDPGVMTPAVAVVKTARQEPAPIGDAPQRAAIAERPAPPVRDVVAEPGSPHPAVMAARPEPSGRLDERVAALEHRLGASAPSASPVIAPADPPAAMRERAIASAPARPAEPFTMEPVIAEHRGPTVRVTIGRLEVRAILPASGPAPKTPRRTPRVVGAPSLDEYLKRRGGDA